MIQRIQSVYLLMVTILGILSMSFPVGHFYTDSTVCEMGTLAVVYPSGVLDYAPWPLFLLLQIAVVLSLVTIFLYKKRMIQIRITKFGLFVLVGYYILLSSYVWGTFSSLGKFVPSWMICFPFIAIVLDYLAVRAIRKDERLVKSYDRLR